MTLSAEALPMILEAHKSESRLYTDRAVSELETRLSRMIDEKISGVKQELTGLLDERQREHDGEMRHIGESLTSLSDNVGGLMREIQSQQVQQGEAIQTLQSDVYGTPARGRKTIFGMIEDLASAVSQLTEQSKTSTQWIEAETLRQAEARQRWHNRQQAAMGIFKMIPSQAWIGILAGAGATALLVLRALLGG